MSENARLDSEQGKQQVDALLAKMSPEQQVEFKAALASNTPVHVHVGKDGSISLGESADEAAEAAKESIKASEATVEAAPEIQTELKRDDPKKPTKLDMKRQQILQDRMKRHMGRGLTQQQAFQAMQREDFEAMPLDKKFSRLESIVSQSFQNLAQEVMGLSQSHMAIADAFDINYRAIQKLFAKLGISSEDQKVYIEEAQKEVIESRKKQRADAELAQLNQRREAQEVSEKLKVEAELQKKDSGVVSNGAQPSEGAEIPKEATVFGG